MGPNELEMVRQKGGCLGVHGWLSICPTFSCTSLEEEKPCREAQASFEGQLCSLSPQVLCFRYHFDLGCTSYILLSRGSRCDERG